MNLTSIKYFQPYWDRWVALSLNLLKEKILSKILLRKRETRFKLTLDRGLKLLGDELATQKDSKLFSGEVAFKLYDTYGFPLDLTEDVLRENDKKVDIEAFDEKMKEQRQKARASWTGSGDKAEEKYGLS